MLVELSVVEQRYHAVMEVTAGVPVTQVGSRDSYLSTEGCTEPPRHPTPPSAASWSTGRRSMPIGRRRGADRVQRRYISRNNLHHRQPRLRHEHSIDVSHAVRGGPRQAGVTPQATVHPAVLPGPCGPAASRQWDAYAATRRPAAFGRQPDHCLRPGTHLVCVADDSPARMVPKPLGAADTLLEAGEEPTDLPHAARRAARRARLPS